MDHERWKALDALLEDALNLATADREPWLADLRSRSPELADGIATLLAAEANAKRNDFLAAPLIRPIGEFQMGAYLLEKPLGHGGMGSVWLGHRTDGRFEGRAAVKLLNQSLLSDAWRERFRREGSMLGRLTHPGIARLLDAGVSKGGQPYLVLEYVEGQPIDAFANERRLTTAGRVKLVLDVLAAVGHAHANLVVHRDIKPSNILVTADGVTKLLDFGIAKLLDVDGGGEPDTLTHAGRALTPAYAAPEQVRGEAITTATDVYAIGVLLYVLLTGRRPYELAERSASEIERIVCETTPLRPSATFDSDSDADDDQVNRAAARGTSPARLRRWLRGDIDLIIMKALRKEPERRYPTAAALEDDLQRLLDCRPISARPDTLTYRVRKFVGRHKSAVAAGIVLTALLAGGVVRERALRGRAEAETRKANAVKQYLVSVFEVSNPFASSEIRGADVTARALLDRGAARVESSLSDEPGVQAELRTVLGRVYTGLGVFDKAEPLLRQALAQRRALYGPRHPEVAEVMDRLGDVLLNQSRFDEAEPLLKEALAQRRALAGNVSAATAESLQHVATLHQERDTLDKAEPLFREAVAIRRAIDDAGPGRQDLAESLNNLGLVVFLRGHYEEAETLYREALAIRVRHLGEDHPLTAQTLQNLAQLLQEAGRYRESEPLHRRALAVKRKTLGDAHPSVTISLNNLGSLLAFQLGRPDQAEPLFREALALDRKMFGEKHGYVSESLRNLGNALRMQGDLDGAEQCYRQSLAMNRELYGAEHMKIALNVGSLGIVKYLQGDLASATTLLRESVAQQTRLLNGRHRNVAAATILLAKVLRDDGQEGHAIEAEKMLRDSLSHLDAANPAHRDQVITGQVALGMTLTELKRPEEALPLLEPAFAMSRQRFDAEDWRMGEAQLALGLCLQALGQHARAEPLLRDAAETLHPHRRAQPRLASQADRAVAGLRGASAARAAGVHAGVDLPSARIR